MDTKCAQATPRSTLLEQLMNPNVAKREREWAAAAEIDRLRELISACRGSVKTDLNAYERMVLERQRAREQRTVTDDAVEDEVQRLSKLLEQIDALPLKMPNG